ELGEPLAVVAVAPVEQAEEELLLRAEVVQEARLRQTGRGCDRGERGAAEALAGEDPERRLEDRLLAALALRCRPRRSHGTYRIHGRSDSASPRKKFVEGA